MEKLLKIQEIKLIERNASDPVMTLPNVIGFMGGERFHLTIATISKKGLIFIIGNQSTGLSHIQRRHYFNSYPKDWTEFKDQKGQVIEKRDFFGDKIKRLDNPSRFDISLFPVVHLSDIADDIYATENFETNLNKSEDVFDLYQGFSNKLENKKVQYRMLLYKDSKIVHTIIPLVNKSKRKRKINYAKGNVTLVKHLSEENIENIEIPYLDQNNNERYKIIIRRNSKTGKEILCLQVNSKDGRPKILHFLKMRKTRPNLDMEKLFEEFDINDLPEFEKIIKEYENAQLPTRNIKNWADSAKYEHFNNK